MSRMIRIAMTVALTTGIAITSHAQTPVKPPAKTKAECDKMMASMDHSAAGEMDHAAMMAMMKDCPMAMPAGEKMAIPMAVPMGGKMAMAPMMPGQAAFGAIGEIVLPHHRNDVCTV